MGTRGVFGFRENETDYLIYNGYDSYPTGLGIDVSRAIKNIDWTRVKNLNLKTINTDREDELPNEEESIYLRSKNKTTSQTWYRVFSNYDKEEYIKDILYGDFEYITQNNSFINDSLFCEWGYIINLDDMILEVYEGFQKKKPVISRYKDNPVSGGYYPCELILELDLMDPEIVEKVRKIGD